MVPALSPKAVATIVQRGGFAGGAKRGLWRPQPALGLVTEDGRPGIALLALMALTEHRFVTQVIGYVQAGDASNNPAVRLLDL